MERIPIIIVLGCGILPDGSPSELLRERLDTAFVSWLLNQRAIIVTTGGKGAKEPIPEAEAMALYLAKRGVTPNRLLQEPWSHTTAENIGNAKSVMERVGIDTENARVTIVSNDFHVGRAKMLAKRFGFQNVDVLSAPTKGIRTRMKMHIREPLAWCKSLALDWPNRIEPPAAVSEPSTGGSKYSGYGISCTNAP